MPRCVLTIRDLGEEACWLLVQQALGMPGAKIQSDFMASKVALLIWAAPSLPERLCVSAAVRQMGGATVYEGDSCGPWRQELDHFQEHLLPIFGYYLDCMYVHGIPAAKWDAASGVLHFPVINAGSPDAHPAHALADIACMLKLTRDLKGVTCAWIGCANGTLYSLLESTRWFPFALRIALPNASDKELLRKRAEDLGTQVSFVDEPLKAVCDASFIFAGCRSGVASEALSAWRISPALMAAAGPDARLILSSTPIAAIPVDPVVLASPASQLKRQAEYRLRIHKRILHWVFL